MLPRRTLSSLILIILTLSLLLTIYPASCITRPAVPQFTVDCFTATYNETITDPYTGITSTHQYSNRSIQLTIKNQPAPDANHQIFYNIRYRPHFQGNWTELYPLVELPTGPYDGQWNYGKYLYHPDFPRSLNQSNGEFTVFIPSMDSISYAVLSNDVLIDFQVLAIVGHNSQAWYIQHPFTPTIGGLYASAVAYDSDSGWSDTQTLTISPLSATPTDALSTPQNSSAPSNQTGNQTSTLIDLPIVNLLEPIAFAALAVVLALLVVVIFLMRRRISTLEHKNSN
jgi:hypothetical protein